METRQSQNQNMITPKGTVLPFQMLKGKQYLQVAYRLVWFREEKPDWRIETDFVQINDQFAMAKATIRDNSGNIMATAHKREDARHFADFCEKCETGAVGRALAMIGYGTQFAPEMEESESDHDEGSRIADAPLDRKPKKTMTMNSDNPAIVASGKFAGKTIGSISTVELQQAVKDAQDWLTRVNKSFDSCTDEFKANYKLFCDEVKARLSQ